MYKIGELSFVNSFPMFVFNIQMVLCKWSSAIDLLVKLPRATSLKS